MRRPKLTSKLIAYVIVGGALEGVLTVWLYHTADEPAARTAALVAGGLAAMLLLVLGLFVARQIARPMRDLTEAVRRLGEGRFETPVETRAAGEIGLLADAFRVMQQRLAEMVETLERRVAERTAQWQETNDFLQSVLDSATEYAIIATDTEWRVQSLNEGARRLFGYEDDEVLGRTLEPLIAPEDVERAIGLSMVRDLKIHGRHEGEAGLRRKSGARFPARMVTTRRAGPDGRPLGYTVIARDVTHSKVLEERLRRYTDNLEQAVADKTAELRAVNEQLIRANQLKGQFLTNMSHELRTPLNAILGFAEALRDGVAGDLSEEQREFAEDIYQAGHQLLGMINDILDLAKVEAGALELHLSPCDLASLTDEVVRVSRGLARRKGVELDVDIEPRPLELTADAMKLKQILYNLLSNGIKFTGAGGRVTVRARLLKEVVEIQVTDTGAGIAPEDLVTIFEQFRQVDSSLARKHEGTGLGLALTRRLVHLHGGEIAVDSEVGRGTTFTVTLLRDLVPEAGETAI
jgi:PAS domain S-box-containing protein